MKIKFKDLKNISENGDDYFVDYLNQFEGEDIYEKFKNILIAWERDVSYDISFNIEGKDIKVGLFYLIGELENYDKESFWVENDEMSASINVPKKFSKNQDIFRVGDFMERLKYLNFDMDLTKMEESQKEKIIESLPASMYNFFIENILKNESKTIKLSNPALKTMNINFLGDSPFQMLKGLFRPYNNDYYRDIIYHLSRKIDGKILMNSTMMDIEYYIEKLNQESKEEKIPELY